MSLISRLLKRKHKYPCYLCGRDASKDYSELSFQATDESGEYSVSVHRICKSCSDTLDSREEELGELTSMIDWEGLQKEIDELDPK